MSWYRTGTATVGNGSTAVTGITTGWLNQAKPEDRITFDGGGKWYEIAAVASNTSITLATAFAEATVTGGVYAIDRSGRGWGLVSDLNARVAALLAQFPTLAGAPDALKMMRANLGGTAFELLVSTPAPGLAGAGDALKFVRANTGGTALEMIAGILAPVLAGAGADALKFPRANAGGTALEMIAGFLAPVLAGGGADALKLPRVNAAGDGYELTSDVLSSFAVNLLEDSGRFAPSTDWKSIFAAGAFQTPAYFTLYNSSTWTNHGKFIFNNNDYGGSAGALNADVKDLIDKIRDSGFRRYGVEFYVAKLTKGSGTASAISVNSTNYYETLYSRQMPRLMASTMHLYARAKTGNAYFRSTGQTIYKDGVKESAGLLLTPGDGWKSVRITDIINPRAAFGYTPATLDIYQANTSDEVLLACPALFGGITNVNIDIGPVPAYNLWSLA